MGSEPAQAGDSPSDPIDMTTAAQPEKTADIDAFYSNFALESLDPLASSFEIATAWRRFLVSIFDEEKHLLVVTPCTSHAPFYQKSKCELEAMIMGCEKNPQVLENLIEEYQDPMVLSKLRVAYSRQMAQEDKNYRVEMYQRDVQLNKHEAREQKDYKEIMKVDELAAQQPKHSLLSKADTDKLKPLEPHGLIPGDWPHGELKVDDSSDEDEGYWAWSGDFQRPKTKAEWRDFLEGHARDTEKRKIKAKQLAGIVDDEDGFPVMREDIAVSQRKWPRGFFKKWNPEGYDEFMKKKDDLRKKKASERNAKIKTKRTADRGKKSNKGRGQSIQEVDEDEDTDAVIMDIDSDGLSSEVSEMDKHASGEQPSLGIAESSPQRVSLGSDDFDEAVFEDPAVNSATELGSEFKYLLVPLLAIECRSELDYRDPRRDPNEGLPANQVARDTGSHQEPSWYPSSKAYDYQLKKKRALLNEAEWNAIQKEFKPRTLLEAGDVSLENLEGRWPSDMQRELVEHIRTEISIATNKRKKHLGRDKVELLYCGTAIGRRVMFWMYDHWRALILEPLSPIIEIKSDGKEKFADIWDEEMNTELIRGKMVQKMLARKLEVLNGRIGDIEDDPDWEPPLDDTYRQHTDPMQFAFHAINSRLRVVHRSGPILQMGSEVAIHPFTGNLLPVGTETPFMMANVRIPSGGGTITADWYRYGISILAQPPAGPEGRAVFYNMDHTIGGPFKRYGNYNQGMSAAALFRSKGMAVAMKGYNDRGHEMDFWKGKTKGADGVVRTRSDEYMRLVQLYSIKKGFHYGEPWLDDPTYQNDWKRKTPRKDGEDINDGTSRSERASPLEPMRRSMQTEEESLNKLDDWWDKELDKALDGLSADPVITHDFAGDKEFQDLVWDARKGEPLKTQEKKALKEWDIWKELGLGSKMRKQWEDGVPEGTVDGNGGDDEDDAADDGRNRRKRVRLTK
jgi:hypothetical protein